MRPKQSSLQQHAKQSHSINVNEIHYSDYIDQQVKQNQITPFSSHHPSNASNHKKTSLKQLNSNEQNKKITSSIDKSNIQSVEIKLYRERVQTLENRLKEKNLQLKLKQQEINKLTTINEELQQFKVHFLLQNSQKSPHLLTKITLEPQQKEVQTDPIKNLNTNNPTNSTFHLKIQEQAIQLQFQLEKYKKKYIIIQQNLKKRVNQYENQLSSLHKKLKQEKLQKTNLQHEIFSLQEENINLKQKLQEAFEQIQSFELQREEITQEMPPTFDIKNLQNNGRRFSFGDDFKQVSATDFIKQQKNVFLSIFNEVSFSFVPQINQQTGRFKGQDMKKRSNYMIRLYPRLYEVKVVGNMKSKNMYDCQETNPYKFVQNGCNTVQKKLYMAACINLKVSIPSNEKKPKQKRNLRICSKEVSFSPIVFFKPEIMRREIPEPNRRHESYEPISIANQARLSYKINPITQNYQRSQINELRQKPVYQKRMDTQVFELHSQKVQNVPKNTEMKFDNVGHKRAQSSSLNQNKDILQRINHHLKNSNLMSHKVQNNDNLPSRQQSFEPQFVKSRPKTNQTLQMQTRARPEYGELRSINPLKTHQNTRYNPQNTYSDWIVDQIHQETNKILQKYTPVQVSDITYHQSYPHTYHTQNSIDKPKDHTMKRSSSIQNIHQSKRTSLTLQNDKNLVRNMSLTSLDHLKLKQSVLKNNTLKLNTTLQSKQSLQLNKTQDFKDSRMTVPLTPSRQNTQKINPSISMKDLIAQKCKKLSIN